LCFPRKAGGDNAIVVTKQLCVCADGRTNADGESIVCRLCIEEDTVGSESYLKQDEVCELWLSHKTTLGVQ